MCFADSVLLSSKNVVKKSLETLSSIRNDRLSAAFVLYSYLAFARTRRRQALPFNILRILVLAVEGTVCIHRQTISDSYSECNQYIGQVCRQRSCYRLIVHNADIRRRQRM